MGRSGTIAFEAAAAAGCKRAVVTAAATAATARLGAFDWHAALTAALKSAACEAIASSYDQDAGQQVLGKTYLGQRSLEPLMGTIVSPNKILLIW